MAKQSISKSALKKNRDQLRLLERFLPSLDLKRQQLLTEQKKAQQQLITIQEQLETATQPLDWIFKLLSAWNLDLEGLVTVDSVVIEEENIVGARLPIAREVKFKTADYSILATPFWIDQLIEYVQRLATIRIHIQIATERVQRLNLQVRRITQRVNLFEKRLIPEARANIKWIQIGLGEQERSAVVRSKISKKKRVT